MESLGLLNMGLGSKKLLGKVQLLVGHLLSKWFGQKSSHLANSTTADFHTVCTFPSNPNLQRNLFNLFRAYKDVPRKVETSMYKEIHISYPFQIQHFPSLEKSILSQCDCNCLFLNPLHMDMDIPIP